jgi:tRNA G18 (ribose-2'-O)-methylase SpoU
MPITLITDPNDHRLEDYRGVSDPALLERSRLFIAEGRLVVARLLTGGRFETRSVLVTRPALASLAGALPTDTPLPVYVVPQPVMNGVTGFNIHRGCLAVGVRRPPEAWAAVIEEARRLIVLERVSNADNVGAIFRSAAAFGIDAVLLGAACADPLYRKAIRTSMGAALSVPFAHATPWPDALGQLRALGVDVVAMTLDHDATPLSDVAAAVATRRTALLLGHEGQGLGAEALALSTHRARIPMAAGVDSLNVATAGAIALYAMSRT